MYSLDATLVAVAVEFARARRVSLWRVGHLAAGRGSFFVDLQRGHRHCRTNTYSRTLQWLSDHWPAGAEWPAGTPRPVPSSVDPPPRNRPAAPPARRAATRQAIRETVATARQKRDEAAMAADTESIGRHTQEVVAAALTLNDEGELADPNALCMALGIHRDVYDDARRRYAGHPERQPRSSHEPISRMVAALRASGDKRFTASSQPPQEAA